MGSDTDFLELRALDLVEQALALPPPAREAFVRAQSGDNHAVSVRALAILAANQKGAPNLRTGGALVDPLERPTPIQIGAYRIEREIGRGGMGAVYLGRRVAEDFEHVAAIKVLRLAVPSPRLIERLRAERRTLARLKHPNIAQFHDGGETPEGEPYVIMEYVEGVPLHKFLLRAPAPLMDRLRLFLDVCSGVAYAHRNLVIHRDLSPANVLVTEDQRAKLIDFGIAQSLKEADQGENDGPRLTMTQGYAAPERLAGAPASTVTDIYSLGVLLGDILSGVRAKRQEDLNAIIAKAQAAAPDDRYQTVEALEADLRAYLAGEAVSARNGGGFYRFSRFVARRRIAFAAAAVVATSISAASVVSSILFLRATKAEQVASQRFEEVRTLANTLMFDLHDEVARLDGSLAARRKLVDTSLRYLDALAATPDAPVELKLELARGYTRLADVAGNPGSINLGDRAQAALLFEKSQAMIDAALQAAPDDPAVLRAAAATGSQFAVFTSIGLGDLQGALQRTEATHAQLATLKSLGAARHEDLRLDAQVLANHGKLLGQLGKPREAIREIEEAISRLSRLVADQPQESDTRVTLAGVQSLLGEQLFAATQEGADLRPAIAALDHAISLAREAVAAPRSSPNAKVTLATALLRSAQAKCYVAEHAADGLRDAKASDALLTAMLVAEPGNDSALERLGHLSAVKIHCHYNAGKTSAAVAASLEAIARRNAYLDRYPTNVDILRNAINTYSVAASLEQDLARHHIACAHARASLPLIERLRRLDKQHIDTNADLPYLQEIARQCVAGER